MTYHVRWIQAALDELTELWMKADSSTRKVVNQAVVAIDRDLATDPLAVSESREPGEWVHFSDPLGVLIEIDASTLTVWVLSVWRYR
jgi:hypothetical protein